MLSGRSGSLEGIVVDRDPIDGYQMCEMDAEIEERIFCLGAFMSLWRDLIHANIIIVFHTPSSFSAATALLMQTHGVYIYASH